MYSSADPEKVWSPPPASITPLGSDQPEKRFALDVHHLGALEIEPLRGGGA